MIERLWPFHKTSVVPLELIRFDPNTAIELSTVPTVADGGSSEVMTGDFASVMTKGTMFDEPPALITWIETVPG